MLRAIDKNIWVGEQPLKYLGLNVGTRMTVIRLVTGELVVISPIQVDSITINQLNSIGNVNYIIAPNLYHYLFATDFKSIYPKAQFWATPGLEFKRTELPIDKILSFDERSSLNGVDYLLFDGFKTLDTNGYSLLNECVFFHQESHTLVLTDTAYYFDESFSLTTQLAAKLIGSYKKLRPSLLERIATGELEKVKLSVQKVLSWDFNRVVMAHGSIVESDAKQKFREGYEWFLGMSLTTVA